MIELMNRLDRFIFKLLLLILVVTMLFNTYANWKNKSFQQNTMDSLDKMELVVKDIPTNIELKQKMEDVLSLLAKIELKLGLPEEIEEIR
jgi:hypothetical protein